MRTPGVVAILLMLLGCGPPFTQTNVAVPQSPSKCAHVEAPPELANQAGYRQITVIAEGDKGQALPKLSRADLHLYQDTNEVPIRFFQPKSATVGILIDTSGSMENKLPQARTALEAFVDDLNPEDEIFLIAFSDRPLVIERTTADHAEVVQHFDVLRAWGRTALFDSIILGLKIAAEGCNPRKVLLVLTDGMDDASRVSAGDLTARARSTKIPIYSIGIGNPNIRGPYYILGPFYGISSGGSDLEKVDAKTLTALSEQTGAASYIVATVGDGDPLKKATTRIAGKVDNHYTVGFVTPSPEKPLRLELVDHKTTKLTVEGGNVTVGTTH